MATPQAQPKKNTQKSKILMILLGKKYINIAAYRNTDIKTLCCNYI